MRSLRGSIVPFRRGDSRIARYTLSVAYGDSSLRRARSAALTAHRAVIHYRRLRFAYPQRESVETSPSGRGGSRMADGEGRYSERSAAESKNPRISVHLCCH